MAYSKESSSFGPAAIACGLLALLASFVPFVKLGVFILAPITIVFAIVAYYKNEYVTKASAAGALCAIIALGLTLWSVLSPAPPPPEPVPAEEQTQDEEYRKSMEEAEKNYNDTMKQLSKDLDQTI